MRTSILLLLALSFSSSLSATENCVLYLPNYRAADSSSTAEVPFESLLPQRKSVFKNDPSQRAMILRQILLYAERKLKQSGVAIFREGEGEKTYLRIAPLRSTPLGTLAYEFREKYKAELVLSPWRLLHSDYAPELEFAVKTVDGFPKRYPIIALSWETLTQNSLRRNEALLTQATKAAIYRDLERLRYNPYQGSLHISRGTIPGDPIEVLPDARFYYLSELKSLRRMAVIKASQLKAKLNNDLKWSEETLSELESLRLEIFSLFVVSQRAARAIQLYVDHAVVNPNEPGPFLTSTDYADGILTWHLSYKADENSYTLNIPIVGSRGLADPDNTKLWAEQLGQTKDHIFAVAEASEAAFEKANFLKNAETLSKVKQHLDEIIRLIAPF